VFVFSRLSRAPYHRYRFILKDQTWRFNWNLTLLSLWGLDGVTREVTVPPWTCTLVCPKGVSAGAPKETRVAPMHLSAADLPTNPPTLEVSLRDPAAIFGRLLNGNCHGWGN
jgi:hypothetical protein